MMTGLVTVASGQFTRKNYIDLARDLTNRWQYQIEGDFGDKSHRWYLLKGSHILVGVLTNRRKHLLK